MTLSIHTLSDGSGAEILVGAEKSASFYPGGMTLNGINGGQFSGLRNKIINGKMEFAQRGTSFTNSNDYTLDRWIVGYSTTTGRTTATQEADVPANTEFQYSLRATCTTADTSIAAGDLSFVTQRIEGYNIRDLIGKTFTVSFWVRSSKTGIHCVALQNNTPDRSYIAEFTINAANTWEFKTIVVENGLPITGTWNYTNGVGLRLTFTLMAGTTYQSTPNSWLSSNVLSTDQQVNVLDTVGNIFAITGVQLEVGAVATPFEHRSYGIEQMLCMRYYQRDIFVSMGGGATPTTTARGYWCVVNFPVAFRATPTMTNVNTVVNSNMSAVVWDNLTAWRGRAAGSNSVTNDPAFAAQYAANAEL